MIRKFLDKKKRGVEFFELNQMVYTLKLFQYQNKSKTDFLNLNIKLKHSNPKNRDKKISGYLALRWHTGVACL